MIMNHRNEPVKILVKQWARIKAEPIVIGSLNSLEFAVPEFLTPHLGQGIPMDEHLKELIRIPESDTGNFLHTYRAKFLPQEYDAKSQKLLRTYSNKIVQGLEQGRVGKTACDPVDKYLCDFCNREGISYEYLEYCTLTMKYFIFLLPQIPLISKEKKSFVSDLECVYKGDTSGLDTIFSDSIYHSNRFSFLPELHSHMNFVKNMINEAGESQAFYRLVAETDLAHQKRWATQKSKQSLRQCIFCYRFFEGVGRVPRTCTSDKCMKADKAWRTFIDARGCSPEDFGFFNRLTEESVKRFRPDDLRD
jgi:hypothetical protein